MNRIKLAQSGLKQVLVGIAMAITINAAAGETKPQASTIENIDKILSQKAPQELIKALKSGEHKRIIVLFDDNAIQSQIEAMKGTVGSKSDIQAILDFKQKELNLLKQEVLSQISSGDITLALDYSHLPMATLRLDSLEALSTLLNNPKVVRVYENKQNQMFLNESLPLINQPAAANAGYWGGGTVAVLDTGVDYTNPAFGDCVNGHDCRVAVAGDFAPDDGQLDDNGHGTNVAAIVLGVAPGAYIAAIDVFDGPSAPDEVIINAINWAIANQGYYNIVAMNLSLGNSQLHSDTECRDSPYDQAFASAREVGILPIVAAGNEARKNGISYPACAPGAVSVGAVYDDYMGSLAWRACTDSSTAPDQVTCFSNSGHDLTILAPGALITAAGITIGGTSQATPHVAGAVAVLRAAFQGETLEQTVSRMTNGGVPVTDPYNGLTHPRLDLVGAINWQP